MDNIKVDLKDIGGELDMSGSG